MRRNKLLEIIEARLDAVQHGQLIVNCYDSLGALRFGDPARRNKLDVQIVRVLHRMPSEDVGDCLVRHGLPESTSLKTIRFVERGLSDDHARTDCVL